MFKKRPFKGLFAIIALKQAIYIVILYCNALGPVPDLAKVQYIRIYPDNPKFIILVIDNQRITGAGQAD